MRSSTTSKLGCNHDSPLGNSTHTYSSAIESDPFSVQTHMSSMRMFLYCVTFRKLSSRGELHDRIIFIEDLDHLAMAKFLFTAGPLPSTPSFQRWNVSCTDVPIKLDMISSGDIILTQRNVSFSVIDLHDHRATPGSGCTTRKRYDRNRACTKHPFFYHHTHPLIS